jgi:hypothetical protein
MDNAFPHLGNLIGAYLNQDYEYFGDTIEAVLAAYCAENVAQDVEGLRRDVAEFLAKFSANLDQAFSERYGFDFDPKLWQLDARAFLTKVLDVTASYGAVENS